MYLGVKHGRLATQSGAMQKGSEVSRFMALIGHPRAIVEIGAGKGGMLAAFCAAATNEATIVSVDLESGPFGAGASDAELRSRANPRPQQKLHLVRGTSSDPAVVEKVTTLVPNGVDVLFIDGDHTYDGVSSDFRLYSPLVVPGGVIAVHDIVAHSPELSGEVERFWGQLSGVEKREIVAPDERLEDRWGGIGIVLVLRSKP
jgi:cephalosporin hydroxylase